MSNEIILVVDDQPAVVRLIRTILRLEDYLVLTAPGGVEALRLLQTSTIHLMVLDQIMPDPDGVAVLRAMMPKSIPVVVVTASDDYDLHVQLRVAGADEVLTKPFNPLHLLATIKTLLRPRP